MFKAAALAKKFDIFMEFYGLPSCSQKPVTELYPKLAYSNLQLYIRLL